MDFKKTIKVMVHDASAGRSMINAYVDSMIGEEAEDGGPGSGNWGHKGRAGLRGGSGKGGGKHYRGGKAETGYHSSKKDWANGLSGEKGQRADRLVSKYAGKPEKGESATEAAERNIMKSGTIRDQVEMLGLKAESRKWDERKDKIMESLEPDQKKAYDYLMDRYGGEDMITGTLYNDDFYKGDATDDEVKYFLGLKAKALEGDNEVPPMPDSIAYGIGLKKKVTTPSYDWIRNTDNQFTESKANKIVSDMLGRQSTDTSPLSDEDYFDAEREMATRLASKSCSFKDMKTIHAYNELRSRMANDKYLSVMLADALKKGTPIKGLTPEESEEFKDMVFSQWRKGASKEPDAYMFHYDYDSAVKDLMKRKDTAQKLALLEAKIAGMPPADTPEMEAERQQRRAGIKADAFKERSEEQKQRIKDYESAHWNGKETAKANAEARKKGEKVRNYGSDFASKTGAKHYDEVASRVDACKDTDAVRVWDTYMDSIRVADANLSSGTQHYNGREHAIFINTGINERGTDIAPPFETTFHESGHMIDYTAARWHNGDTEVPFSATYKNGIFHQTIKQEVDEHYNKTKDELAKAFKEHAGDRQWFVDKGIISQYDRLPERISSKLVWKYMENQVMKLPQLHRGDISDMFQAGSVGKIGTGRFGYIGHHKAGYFTSDRAQSNCSTEAFSEMYAATFTHPESLQYIKTYFPKSYKVFQEMLVEMAK